MDQSIYNISRQYSQFMCVTRKVKLYVKKSGKTEDQRKEDQKERSTVNGC